MGPILDVDGTLVDTSYHHALGWYRAFRRFDVAIPLARLHRFMGMGGDQLVSEVAGEDFQREHGDDVRDVEKQEYEGLIGDAAALDQATWDCEAAGRAGVPIVGVLMGGFSETELRESGAKRVYSGLQEIVKDLDALLAEAAPVDG